MSTFFCLVFGHKNLPPQPCVFRANDPGPRPPGVPNPTYKGLLHGSRNWW
jgi:hypothetical protein